MSDLTGNAIPLHHPDSGANYTAVDEAQADVLAESGWERVDAATGTVAEVVARVNGGDVSAAHALAAEKAKGSKARASLVEQLEPLAAADPTPKD